MGNFLSNLKASKSKVKITDVDVAVLELKHARKRLLEQQKRQELLANRARDTTAELLRAKNKDRALVALKKQKLHQNQIVQICSCVFRIDEQLAGMETTSQQLELVSVLKASNSAIKQMQTQMKVEDVERLMEDTAESAQYMNDMNQLLSQSTVPGEEEDLAEELSAIEDAVLKEQMAALPVTPQVPAVVAPAVATPATNIPAASKVAEPEAIPVSIAVEVPVATKKAYPTPTAIAKKGESVPAGSGPAPGAKALAVDAPNVVQTSSPMPVAKPAELDAAVEAVSETTTAEQKPIVVPDDEKLDLPDVPTKKVESKAAAPVNSESEPEKLELVPA